MFPLKTHLTKTILTLFIILFYTNPAHAWYAKTHLAIAKAAGCRNWYNAAAADTAKLKAGRIEEYNHFYNSNKDTGITPEEVLAQADRYNDPEDSDGHLYGAVIASVRCYIENKKQGKYAEDHMAYCAHYVGDLSMPLHNIPYTAYNKKYHMESDGIIDKRILNNAAKIKIYKIKVSSEQDLAKEIAKIANISASLGYRLEQENRMITKEEAYIQAGHSASLLKAILEYVKIRS